MPEKSDLQKLKTALDDLGATLQQPAVKEALSKLAGSGATSSFIGDMLGPVIDGLIEILKAIRDAVSDIGDVVENVAALEPLIPKVGAVLEAAGGVVDSEKLSEVGADLQKLDNLPSAADVKVIKQGIIDAINMILSVLESI